VSSIPSQKEEAYSDYLNKATALNNQAINILYKIGKPDMNGKYSPEKMELWQKYYGKDAEAKNMFDEMIRKTQ
jgi:hypothetical protein